MRLCVLAGCILLTGITALAEEGNVVDGGERTGEPSVAKAFPEEYATYVKALAENNGTNLVHAALVLLAKSKESLHGTNATSNETQNHINVYCGAWRLCIRAMQESQDQPSRRLVVDEWNRSLMQDDEAVPSQIYALAGRWSREFLTDEFWKALQETRNRKTVSAMGYALFQHGNQSDLDQMLRIEKQTPGRGLPNAISWLRFRLSGDTTNPGPAAAPPRIE